MNNKKIVILTSHVFLDGFRKASVHFVARQWAAQGHEVHFTTVGYSRLSMFRKALQFRALRKQQNNRYAEIAPGLHAGAYLPLLHAFSSASSALNTLSGPMFRAYGRSLPDFVAERIRSADLVVLESGTPLAFFALVRSLNPAARTLYFCRDLLRTVGAAPVLQEIERETVPLFDRICVPSQRLAELLPAGGRVEFIPQGVDPTIFDAAERSPYAAGSRNAVAVGDMLFDRNAVRSLAKAAPGVTFHLFGIDWQGEAPSNIRIHGERSFEAIAPYIRHADLGLAPYRVTGDEIYLAESSLKLLQYSYCLLPVVMPDALPVARGNEVKYRLMGENSWRGIVERALALRRCKTLRSGILTWDEVSRRTLAAAFA
ncbi:polysaccharide biosynthesis protein GumK [Rhizobium sp. TRM95796]|uniref:GumK N-terminal domain-containing glycosyltransferase n=1 Tax=Rhizobium sp. TRM95796 TaxID=2979862 RepID=UPI0021E85327|nr:polysaccharide biosynthesis protein GumK [Rhizobium sp. TRM95796]MCV3768808.1 polysaccharide biosynthesis protein GumK [Rhizobium sp. TRM95796]